MSLKKAHPDCDVTVEYARSKEVEEDTTEDVHHLIWASDRLEIARGIEARLARIYTDLVMIEKFLHYRHSLLDWAKEPGSQTECRQQPENQHRRAVPPAMDAKRRQCQLSKRR